MTVGALGRACVLVAGTAIAAACGAPRESGPTAETPWLAQVPEVPVGPLPGPARFDMSGAPNPFADDAEALREGRLYFRQYNCAGCHGEHGGGGMGPSLRDTTWLYGSSHAQIARSIADGRAYGMPAWGAMLTPAQIWQITAYIKSMRTEAEPSPPES